MSIFSIAGSTPSDEGFELKSARFNRGDSAQLTRHPTSESNRRTFTLSAWAKGTVSASSSGNPNEITFLNAGDGVQSNDWNSSIQIRGGQIAVYDHGGTYSGITSNNRLRDPAAWYHIVVAVDTTQGTAADRVKMYINNELVTSTFGNIPAQDFQFWFNRADKFHSIGRNDEGGGPNYSDGYIAEQYWIDGAQLTPASFGELNEDTGQWEPTNPSTIKQAVTFGTNGFYLPFSNDALAASFTDSATGFAIGAFGNAHTDTTIKKIGTASAQFDGVGDYLEISPSPGSNFPVGTTWTLEGWFYFNTAMASTNLEMGSIDVTGSNDKQTNKFCVQNNGSNAGSIRFISGLDGGYNANAYFQTTGASPLSQSTWHHIAVGQNAGTAFIYVDGVSKSVTTVGSPSFLAVTNNTTTAPGYKIGANTGGYGMNGYIDEFRISNIARYTTNFTPATVAFTSDSNTNLLMHMDGTDGGTTFTDSGDKSTGTTPIARHPITVSGNTKNARVSNLSFDAIGNAHIIGPKQGTSTFFINNGATSNLSMPDSADWMFGTGDFTLEMWVNTTKTGVSQYLMGQIKASNGTDECFMRIDSAGTWRLGFVGASGGIAVQSTSVVPKNTWTHLAVVRDGTTFRLYTNGVQEATNVYGTGSQTEPTAVYFIGATAWIAPGGGGAPNDGYYGYMDGVRISKGVCRYPDGTTFTPPTDAFTSDAQTVFLLQSGTGGTFTDTGNTGHTITKNGSAIGPWIAPKIGTGCAVFDGTGDYLSEATGSGLAFGTSDFTLEGWVNFSVVQNQGIMLLTDAATNNAPYFQYYASQLQFGINGIASVNVYTWTPTANTWYHVAVSRHRNTCRMFIDGTLVDTATSTTAFISDGLVIGAWSSRDWNGYMDEIRISRTARYTGNFTPSTEPFKDDKDTALLLHMDGGGGIDPETNLPTLAGQGTYFWDASTDSIFYDSEGLATNKSYMDFPGGGSDYLTTPASPDFDFGTGDTTIEYWTKTTQTATSRVVTRGDNPKQWFFRSDTSVASECVKTYIGGGIVNFDLRSEGELIADGTWHHLALVRTSTALRYFIDGVQKAIATVSGSWDTTSITDVVAIGQGITSGTGEDYDGFMDQLRISNTARYGVFTPTESITADILVVAGGGGGARTGGGGGAGGFQEFTSQALTAQGYVVTVGAGGKGNNTDGGTTENGGNSSFGALTASVGGGGGGAYDYAPGGNAGGSGGGGGLRSGSTPGGAGTAGQGNAGGASLAGQNPPRGTGGGGGATAAGAAGTSASSGTGGAGGAGDTNDYQTGSNITYAGGGGGSGTFVAGAGGAGGGGAGNTGQNAPVPIFGTPGTDGLGGGGGAGYDDGGGNGGSGIVIIRYLSPTPKATGGTITTYGAGLTIYQVHTFENQAFTPPTEPFTADSNTKLLVQSDWSEGGLGADHSGNYNYWTPANLTASDSMPDSPTNNFAILNPLAFRRYGGSSNEPWGLSQGHLKGAMNSANHQAFVCGTMTFSSGKWYYEWYQDVANGGNGIYCGIGQDRPCYNNNNYFHGASIANCAWTEIDPNSGNINNNCGSPSSGTSYGSAYGVGDLIMTAVDMDAGKVWWGKNGTWFASGDPGAGTNEGASGLLSVSGVTRWLPWWDGNASGGAGGMIVNFGQDSSFAGTKTAQGNQDRNGKGDFYYEVPSGFLALCTDNMATPSIKLPVEYFNTILRNGTGSSGGSFTGVGFSPDFLWQKARSGSGNHWVTNPLRGATKYVWPNSTVAEATDATFVSSLDADGFTMGSNDWGTSTTVVAWNWKAGGTPTATNSAGAGNVPTAGSVKINGANSGAALAGTIPATKLSANTSSGFSIIEYTGTGVAGSIGHGLSQAPQLWITKNTVGTNDWMVGTTASFNASNYQKLNSNTPWNSSSGVWNNADPTSSIINLGTDNGTNDDSDPIICYAWHSIEGYQTVDWYGGNANADGGFAYTGFRPALLLTFNYDSGDMKLIVDNKRLGYNQYNLQLLPNTTDTEAATGEYDILSNGFKARTAGTSTNSAAGPTVFLAIAEFPFKYANAR